MRLGDAGGGGCRGAAGVLDDGVDELGPGPAGEVVAHALDREQAGARDRAGGGAAAGEGDELVGRAGRAGSPKPATRRGQRSRGGSAGVSPRFSLKKIVCVSGSGVVL